MAARHRLVKEYLRSYGKLVVSERVNDKAAAGESLVISVPLHVAGDHRVEITITEFSHNRFLLSDTGRTLSSLTDGGRSVTADFRKRAEEIASSFGAHFVLDYLLLECDARDVGTKIQVFAEASKTIGDAYLLQRSRHEHVRQVVSEVKKIFEARRLTYKEDCKVKGVVEKHPFDVYVAPNGRPGVAIAVIAGHNTHALAKVWAFNCSDVREAHQDKLRLGVVIDEEDSAPWTNPSRKILKKGADIVASSSDLNALDHGLLFHGIVV